MPELLSSEEIYLIFEKIILTAVEKVYLITQVFSFSEKIYECLSEASDRGVKVTIVFSTDELTISEKTRISGLANIEVYGYPDLNSCCYFNEKEMLITSLDLADIYERKGGNINIILSRTYDEPLFDKIQNLIKTFIEASIQLIPGSDKKISDNRSPNVYHGFCIKCGMPISYNVKKPFCRQCIIDKIDDSRSTTVFNYCHSCAGKVPVTSKKPLCADCSIIELLCSKNEQ